MNDPTYEMGTDYSTTGTPAVVSTTVRTGTYSLELRDGESVGYNVSGATAIYMGVAVYLDSVSGYTYDLISFFDSDQLMALIKTAIGGALVFEVNNTDVATSERVIAAGGWYYIEVYYLPDDSTGVCTIRVNGTEWLTFSGDTRNGDNLAVVRLKYRSNQVGVTTNDCYFDDLVINDTSGSVNNTWPGQQKLYLAVPNAAGDQTDLTPSAGNNWDCVDEIPTSTADYVSSATATEYDLYNITDPLAGTETLGSVVLNIVAKIDSGSGNIATTLKANVTEDDGANIGLTEAWQLYQQAWAVNPDDSAAWAPADIDDLQIGVEIKA